MKVVLTVHQFLPDFTLGTEIIVLNTARELRRRGHEVTIFTGHPGPAGLSDEERFDRRKYDGFEVIRFLHAWAPMAGRSNIVQLEYDNPLFYRFFREQLAENRPDVVHFLHVGRLSTSGMDAALHLKIPAVFTATDFWAVCPLSQLRLWDNTMCSGPDPLATNCIRHLAINSGHPRIVDLPDPLLTILTRAARLQILQSWRRASWIRAASLRPAHILDRLNRLDRIIAPSGLMASTLTRAGVDRDRVDVLPYGIDIGRFRRMTDKGQHERLRIGFLGAVSEHKGCDLLIRAFRSLPAEAPASLRVFGDLSGVPEYGEMLQRLAAEDRRISFGGAFPNENVSDLLSELDVVVVPSIWYENTPVVIYEAMAAGCVVAASDVAGISEVVQHGHNGLLFQPGSVDQIASCLSQVVDDRDLVARLASNACRPLSLSEHGSALESIYQHAIAAHRSS